MEQKELDRIIANHRHWINRDCDGWESMKADLSGADLSNADLSGAVLKGANLIKTNLSMAFLNGAKLALARLHGANLYWANLQGADLFGANLYKATLATANLSGADLSNTDLSNTDLSCANLRGANLTRATMRGANLSGANLTRANLSGVDLIYANAYDAIFDEKEKIRKGVILSSPMQGYKKTAEKVVITVEIPAGAIVFSINGDKCRTNMATVLDTEGHDVLHSRHDPNFTYTPGQKIVIPDFDLRYNVECAPGFHFFRTKEEAMKYCY